MSTVNIEYSKRKNGFCKKDGGQPEAVFNVSSKIKSFILIDRSFFTF